MNKFFKVIVIFMFIPVILHFSYLFDKAVFYFKAPKTNPISLQPYAVAAEHVLLVPLDSRPPCLSFVKKLGQIANITIVSPPEDIFDNYNTPAPVLKVNEWFYENIQNADAAIISLDMLRHGGLIASRSPKDDLFSEASLFEKLSKLPEKTTHPIYAFSIIPRLLIPEDDKTKLWQYHVMIYATRKDMNDTFENPRDFNRMQEMLSRVPPELINTFNDLYEKNDVFNHKLSLLQEKDIFAGLIFGQDDGQPFGRPNESKYKIEKLIIKNNLANKVATSYGADELAMLQLATHINSQSGYYPKIFVIYSDETVPDMVLHFMPTTIAETVKEKIHSAGAIEVSEKENADIVLFVHAGKGTSSGIDLQKTVRSIDILAKEKPLALVDLSANFLQRETILGTLISENIPLSQLAAYAGWNTAGNSIGTALAQSIIFAKQKESIDKRYLPYLYQKNFEFTLSRVIDDWAYQKDVQDSNDSILRWHNINPYALKTQKNAVQEKIDYALSRRWKSLFYKNIGLYPFYIDNEYSYYITDLDATAFLPWERTFEIDLKISTKTGRIKN